MRRAVVSVFALATLGWFASSVALVLPPDSTASAYQTFLAQPGISLTYVHCPPGFYPVLEYASPYSEPAGLDLTVTSVDASDNPITGSVPPGPGAGYAFSVANNTSHAVAHTFHVVCLKAAFMMGYRVSTGAFPPNGFNFLTGTCPSGSLPVGGGLDKYVLSNFASAYTAFKFGSAYFDDQPTGIGPAPTAFEFGGTNRTSSPITLTLRTACANVPGLQTIIYDAPTSAGNPFSVAAPVPDGYSFVSQVTVGGAYGMLSSSIAWGGGGVVPAESAAAGSFGAGTLDVRAIYAYGTDTRPKSSARAVIGLLVAPTGNTPPAPNVVTVVEFYHQGLDHYFITAIAKEISDLDTGVHPGWARTGKSFKAYGIGSTGDTGRRPVCREYGNPAAGLDSHFYSASPKECVDTLTKFGTNWLLEASEVFEIDLPNETTGACPSGDVPIYRVWNNRADSNHRYTTSIADRDAMVAKGYVAEGYGPDAVTLCALQ